MLPSAEPDPRPPWPSGPSVPRSSMQTSETTKCCSWTVLAGFGLAADYVVDSDVQ